MVAYNNGVSGYSEAERIFLEGIDIVCGGFPCQDISCAGKGAGITGSRSGLWREMLRTIRLVRPKYAIVENVATLLARGMGVILGDLADAGYDTEWDCIPASAVGAPHLRKRIWIIASDPMCVGQQTAGRYFQSINKKTDDFREADSFVRAFHGKALPFVCGGHDGFYEKLDKIEWECRIHALGNAVVPRIPYFIGSNIKLGE